LEFRFVAAEHRVVEAREDHALDARVRQRVDHCGDGDMHRIIRRVVVDAAADRRKRNAFEVRVLRQVERAPVARREQFRLAVPAAVPYRPDRVNHVLGRQLVTTGDFRVAGRAAAECLAFAQQFAACCAVNRAVDAATAQ
jgi:hypothetical protein